MAWHARAISLLDPFLMQFRHWCSKVANLKKQTKQNTCKKLGMNKYDC